MENKSVSRVQNTGMYTMNLKKYEHSICIGQKSDLRVVALLASFMKCESICYCWLLNGLKSITLHSKCLPNFTSGVIKTLFLRLCYTTPCATVLRKLGTML
ncbi:V-set and transmembrane domain-containing protein 2A [Platysternon megacephalum]|uniref:V-set and transmembrane domain-containing protein 2A n=1 Tax=Platysternon megacephalum TaxID=55544 RepID=A0A4D9EQA2_9SAUR|nr:V-set and transmembrane domain-containing protein 2A [Platysternon megacephalum]